MGVFGFISQGDTVTKTVALLLLLMSLASWAVILWKAWLLQRARGDIAHSLVAFWRAPSLSQACQTLQKIDRNALVLPLVLATNLEAQEHYAESLAAVGDKSQQLTRRLRDALHGVLYKLQFGQVLLATVGATAPFVGLLGTVWGIYHALLRIDTEGQVTIDKIAGPVGESLIMTAAGLAVAIPAVLAFNVLGRSVAHLEAELDGFARDLRELFAGHQSTQLNWDV